jgi:ABC-2 type transport system permease protein
MAEARAVPPPRRLPAGWRIIAEKELGDHLLSIRFLILLVLLALVGVGTVYTVSQTIRDAATEATDVTGVFLLLFTLDPSSISEQLPPFVGLIGFLGPLLGIAFGFDAISSERSEGTLPRLVSQPVHRDDVINGKFAAGLTIIVLVLGCASLLVAAVGLVRLGVVPRVDDILRLLAWYAATVVYVGFWLALAMLFSVLFRRAATAALAIISLWLALTLFGRTIVSIVAGFLAPANESSGLQEQIANASMEVDLARLSPVTLYGEMTQVLLDPRARYVGFVLPDQVDRALPSSVLPFGQSLLVVWPQAVALVALTVVCFAAAYISFMRQEVRA